MTSNRIVHQTGIPLDGCEEAYEYPLPLAVSPDELDPGWSDWLRDYVGLNASGVHAKLEHRWRSLSTELIPLRQRVLGFAPFAFSVYDGTPLIWLECVDAGNRDFIYLPPEVDQQQVRDALSPFGLESNALLVELLASFGGMGERWPWEEVEFSGCRHSGTLDIVPTTEAVDAGQESRSAAENEKRRRQFARWIGGVEVLTGGDGLIWHVGPDGSICEHESAYPPSKTYRGIAELIAAFLETSQPDQLFRGPYHGLTTRNEGA